MTEQSRATKQLRMSKLASEADNDDRLEHIRDVILANISPTNIVEFKLWLHKGKRDKTLSADIEIEEAVSSFLLR